MTQDATGLAPVLPTAVAVKFDGVLLVCAACEQRGDGPRKKKLNARDVRKTLKQELARQRRVEGVARLRIVACSCLGLCPKKAMALVALTGHGAPLAAEVKSYAEAAGFACQAAAIR